MFLDSAEFTRLPQAKTTEKTAWKGGSYETYRIEVDLLAVRLHAEGKHWNAGHWFGVERYGATVKEYRKAMALINASNVADSVVLQRGSVFNVGQAGADL